MTKTRIDQIFADLRSRLRVAKFLNVKVLYEEDLDEVERKYNAAPSNIQQLLDQAEEKKQAESLCRKYGLNMSLLSDLYRLEAQGKLADEIGRHLGIHKRTISRYLGSLRSMKESEFDFLYRYILKVKLER